MARSPRAWIVVAVLVAVPSHGFGQAARFATAIESVPDLIQLYTEADAGCRLSRGHSVKIEVACVSRSIYGAALNEKNWCAGREGQANAAMEWHECGADSLRFPPLNLPDL